MRILFFSILLFTTSSFVYAQEWQWSTKITSQTSGETNDHPQAFLWIPPNCKQVKGIVVGMHNMQEEGIMEHPYFRKTMSEIGFAEIWITPGLDPLFDVRKGAQEAFDEMLNSLSEISGYTGIKYAPIVPIGHSAYATFPWNFGAWNPDKTLAILSIHGDAPLTNLTGCGRPNLDWEGRTIEGIPGLMVMGEYEWWEDRLLPAGDYQNTKVNALVSLLADAGHGHFDHSEMLIKYLAMFVKKAAHYRLPKKAGIAHSVELTKLKKTDGWLLERWFPHPKPSVTANAYGKYEGDKENAFWYFDKEIARETEKYYQKTRDKQEQYIGIVQNGELLSFNKKSHARISPKFVPKGDGLTFNLSATFTDSLRENRADNHSLKGQIKIDRICGPVEQLDDTTFTVRFYRMGLNSEKRTGDIWLIAHHDGDDKYKSSVQQLNIRIPHTNKEGVAQKIIFPDLDDVTTKTKIVDLNAKSDSGLPVYYFIEKGPAEIKDNQIVFTKIPTRAKFPVEVAVVAWQYGLNGDKKVQTAEPVRKIFYIHK